MVDHQHLHRTLPRVDLQAELFLECREDRWVGRVGGCRRRRRGAYRPGQPFSSDASREVESRVEGLGVSGLVDDAPTHDDREDADELRHLQFGARDPRASRLRDDSSAAARKSGTARGRRRRTIGTDLHAAAFFRSRQFRSALRDRQDVDRQLASFVVSLQLEPVLQQGLQHLEHFFVPRVVSGGGLDRPAIGIDPGRSADDLECLQTSRAVCILNEQTKRRGRGQPSGKGANHHKALFLRWLDGSDFEFRPCSRLREQSRGRCRKDYARQNFRTRDPPGLDSLMPEESRDAVRQASP